MDTSVRYLIRRSTFKRRSLKSCRSNMSETGHRSRRTSSTSRRRHLSDRQEGCIWLLAEDSEGSVSSLENPQTSINFKKDETEKQSKVIDGGLETPLPSGRSRNTSMPSRRQSMRSSNASAKNFNTVGANGSLPSKLSPRFPKDNEKDKFSGIVISGNQTERSEKSSNGGGLFLGNTLAIQLASGVPSETNAMRSEAGAEVEQPDNDDEGDNPLQKLIAPLISVFQLIIRSSYVATNIVMMAWSITYHS
ncbi:unnamed protein product, partial [Meganyctiphanes norvegica]